MTIYNLAYLSQKEVMALDKSIKRVYNQKFWQWKDF
jgi:hypothetical protein